MDEKQQQQLQDAADSAYARQLWWESTKIVLEDVHGKVEGIHAASQNIPDNIVKDFIKRCESGFFDVKRQTGKGE